MTLTLLFDLDDTLLDTNTDVFLPAYFQALAGALQEHVAPEVMLAALMGGTRLMLANLDPARTLREVFDTYFFAKLGLGRDSLQPDIDRFYDDVFPSLSRLTAARPAAVELVEWAIAQGHRVVIATNPLFPLKAIEHRLRWAGLAPESHPFALVTSYEDFHFTKSPDYYAEVMARLAWPDDPVLMIGDDPDLDVASAQALGIATYHVQPRSLQTAAAGPPEVGPVAGGLGPRPRGTGTIADVRPWIENQDISAFQLSPLGPAGVIAALGGAAAGLAGMVAHTPPEGWERCNDCTEWSLNEIICHLRDVDREVNLPRIAIMRERENPFLAGEATDQWAEERQYDRQDGAQALRDWIAARKQIIGLLRELSPDDWLRNARHAIFGPTNFQELMSFICQHDRTHIQQADRTMRAIL